jgi:pSer/pThr/pTyr-binding forkhead associated (FHA) protein
MVFQRGVEIPHLVVLSPDAFIGRRIELSADYMVVGREQDCDVRFDDPRVSRTHAALQRRGNAVYVQDLGSSGGTFVNGSPAAMTPLRGGDAAMTPLRGGDAAVTPLRGGDAAVTPLRGGDAVTFATVQARFDAPNKAPRRPVSCPRRSPPG